MNHTGISRGIVAGITGVLVKISNWITVEIHWKKNSEEILESLLWEILGNITGRISEGISARIPGEIIVDNNERIKEGISGGKLLTIAGRYSSRDPREILAVYFMNSRNNAWK